MPTATTSESLPDELALLSRAVEGDTFHFVVVQWGHYSQLQRIKTHLRQQYPERPALTLRAEGQTYETLMAPIYAQGRGFVFIDDFEHLLNDPDLCVAFNQRRGKLARLPLSVVCFIPPGGRYVELAQDRLPDWWSVLSFLAVLPNDAVMEKNSGFRNQFQEVIQASTLGGVQQQERLQEIQRLQERIAAISVEPQNAKLLDNLFVQLLKLCETAGLYQLGLEAANEWLKIAFELDYERTAPATYSEVLDGIGTLERYLGHFDRCARLKEAALYYDIKNFGLNHPNVAVRQSNLALVYRNLGNYERARDLLETALASDLINFAPDHPNVAVRRSNLALVYKELGNYERARELLEAALASAQKNFEANDPNVTVSQSNLALVYRKLGNYERARDLLEAALASDLINFGPNHPNTSVSQSNLALVYRDLGNYERARKLGGTALASDLKNFGPDHPNVAIDYNNLALIEIAMGNWLMAKEQLQRALAISLRVWGEAHPNVQAVRQKLASVEAQLQKN